MSLIWTQCNGCINPSECAPHGCAKNKPVARTYVACDGCDTYMACYLNDRCVKQADSAKVEAPTPAADAQDSSYRADKLEISRLMSKLAVQSKLTRDAETQREKLRDELNAKYQQVPEIEAQVTALEAQLRDAGAENDRLRAEAAKPFKLEDNEQYRLQMAAICTAALGYWREGDSIHPDYDTPGLRDVAIRYDAYDKYYQECLRLQRELISANDSLFTARGQIAALVADQRESDADRARELREYVTTKQFHQQQASMAPSRGVSIPAAELDVTEQEGEAFKALEQRVTRAENAYLLLQGRVNTHNDRLDALKDI